MNDYIRALESMRAGDFEVKVDSDPLSFGSPESVRFAISKSYVIFGHFAATSIANQALADRERIGDLEKKLKEANAKIGKMRSAIQSLSNSAE